MAIRPARCTWVAARKMSQGEALQKAKKLKAVELGIEE